MSGPWNVWPVSFGAAWLVSRYPSGGGNSVYAKRRLASGIASAFWPTREAAERAAARLNRKWAHECLGTWCTAHPAPFVERVWTEIGMVWVAWTEDGRGITHGGTHAEAFAAALAYAKENQS